jgi:acyl carrier protein
VPIGQPIADTQAYVLDDRGEPAPIGVEGELYLGGAGVARGYWNRPAETAARFVPDAYGPSAGARLYRTGDRARRLAGGDLQYLGRVDHQVKIRGHRIELGEIETALVESGLVRDAAAVVRDTAAGPQLIAYGVPAEGTASEVAAWRDALAARLPDHMVPGWLIAVDQLPLTASGKVDRQALARRSPSQASARAVAPRDDLERRLHAVWRSVLDADLDDIRVNFFEAGGQSLSAVILARRLSQAFGTELPARAIVDYPTIESMASYLRGARATRVDDSRAATAS